HHRAEVDIEKALGVDQEPAIRLLQAERDLGALEARVDRHRDRADQRRAVEQRQPLLAVPHQDADMVALANTQRQQRAGGLLGLVEKLPIGELPALRHEGLLRPALARLAREHLAQRLLGPAHVLPIHCPAASCWSIASISACSAPAGSSSRPRSMVRLASFRANGGALRMASPMRVASWCRSSTTLATRPAVRASSAVNARPVNIRSFARRLPRMRGRRCVAPTVPRCASGVRNDVPGVATMKSHAAAISTPEPITAP